LLRKQALDRNLSLEKVLVAGVLDEPLEMGVVRFQPVRPRIRAKQAALLLEVAAREAARYHSIASKPILFEEESGS
jgi:hypothetical protein